MVLSFQGLLTNLLALGEVGLQRSQPQAISRTRESFRAAFAVRDTTTTTHSSEQIAAKLTMRIAALLVAMVMGLAGVKSASPARRLLAEDLTQQIRDSHTARHDAAIKHFTDTDARIRDYHAGVNEAVKAHVDAALKVRAGGGRSVEKRRKGDGKD
jgi:hypothetical protein